MASDKQSVPRGPWGEVLGRAVLLCGAYCGLKALSSLFVFPPQENAAVWLPSGLTLAVFLRASRRRWPVYLATVFLTEYFLVLFYGDAWELALSWSLGNCLRTVVGAGLMRRWLNAPVTFSRPREVIALILAGGLLSPLPSATLGVGAVTLFTLPLSPAELWEGWLNWYLSDGLGALLVAPLLLTWSGERSLPRRPWERAELVGALVLLGLVAHVTFGMLSPWGILLSLPYACLPFILWSALRLGPRGAATATGVLGSIAVWHTALGRGPFGVLPATVSERVLSVQVFLSVASMSSLFLAAMARDRWRVERSQRVLAEAGAVFAASMEPRDTLPRVARLLVPELVSGFAVWLVDEQGRWVPAVCVGLTPEQEARLREDVRQLSEPSRRCVRPEGAAVLARIQHQGRVLGGMALVRLGFTHLPRLRAAAFAEDLAHHCALALENARLLADYQAAIHVRDEFITVAAHELRTPLTSLKLQMRSFGRLLQQPATAAPEAVRPRFHSMSRQVERLGRLVEGLLDVGRINTGRLYLERELLDLGELVHDVVEQLSGELERAGCEVSLVLQPCVRGLWDRTRLEQALNHLLGNAAKFGAGHPIELRVEQREDRAYLTVRDQGIGLAPEALERIFGRFERAVSSREYGGLGLGLFLTQRIVEAHEGHIRVTSQPGQGATFVLELPASPRSSSYVPGLAPSPWPTAPADSHPT
ncbi:MASE1 domain-containing protein [Archangium violaceum]|uniref:sensor histidine kinase n=1 Tax=Archangium violaceum TaxID=83451 RepID=UPI0019501408|nr:MASE1 domain-containing protein [Archangium violaceum]QRN96873.1 MASE1 domain-containing protein [Archangium violaceum]